MILLNKHCSLKILNKAKIAGTVDFGSIESTAVDTQGKSEHLSVLNQRLGKILAIALAYENTLEAGNAMEVKKSGKVTVASIKQTGIALNIGGKTIEVLKPTRITTIPHHSRPVVKADVLNDTILKEGARFYSDGVTTGYADLEVKEINESNRDTIHKIIKDASARDYETRVGNNLTVEKKAHIKVKKIENIAVKLKITNNTPSQTQLLEGHSAFKQKKLTPKDRVLLSSAENLLETVDTTRYANHNDIKTCSEELGVLILKFRKAGNKLTQENTKEVDEYIDSIKKMKSDFDKKATHHSKKKMKH